MKGLSPTMQEAMRQAQVHGYLRSEPGGFWTRPGCEHEHRFGYDVPTWFVGKATVQALVDRGLLRWNDEQRRTAAVVVRSVVAPEGTH